MAKQRINRSAAIRDYYKSHRKAKAQEVVDALGMQGITVTTGLVYAAKRKIRGRRRRRLAGVAVATRNLRNDPIKLVQETKALAQKAGGIKKLRELLDVLE